MKKLLLLLIAAGCVPAAAAQQFSGGVRTGTSLWFTKDHENRKVHFTEGQNMTWDKGLFLRYDARKRFAMEIGFSHSFYKNDLSEDPNRGDSYNDWFLDYRYDQFVNNYELEISLQYDVSCSALKSCGLLKNIESNIGLSFLPTLTAVKYDRLYEGGHWFIVPLTHATGSYKEFYLYTGLSHLLKYHVSKKFYLSSKALLAVDPFHLFSEYYSNSFGRPARASLQIGAGYNF